MKMSFWFKLKYFYWICKYALIKTFIDLPYSYEENYVEALKQKQDFYLNKLEKFYDTKLKLYGSLVLTVGLSYLHYSYLTNMYQYYIDCLHNYEIQKECDKNHNLIQSGLHEHNSKSMNQALLELSKKYKNGEIFDLKVANNKYYGIKIDE